MRNKLLFLLANLLLGVYTEAQSVDPNDHAINFKFYKSKEEAATDFLAIEAYTAKLESRDPRPVISFSAPQYPILKGIVHEIYGAYKLLYPDWFRDLPEPYVLIVSDKTENAFVHPDPLHEPSKLCYYFVVHSGFLTGTRTREEVYGVLAHEIAHLFFHHGIKNNSEKIERFYKVDGTNEPFGNQQKNDTKLQELAHQWIENASDIGPFSDANLPLIPLPVDDTQSTFDIFKLLIEKYAAKTQEMACANTVDSFNSFYKLFGESVNGQTLKMSRQDYDKFLAEGDSLANSAQQCLGRRKIPYYDLITEKYGLPIEKIFQGLSEQEKKSMESDVDLFNAQPSSINGIFALVKKEREIMREVEGKVDLSKVRYYSIEEEADDLAVRVLSKLNIDNTKFSLFFSDSECEKILAQGKIPDYGGILDAHHGSCFRTYHIRAFDKFFKLHPDAPKK